MGLTQSSPQAALSSLLLRGRASAVPPLGAAAGSQAGDGTFVSRPRGDTGVPLTGPTELPDIVLGRVPSFHGALHVACFPFSDFRAVGWELTETSQAPCGRLCEGPGSAPSFLLGSLCGFHEAT